jgi:hypothetical protein
VPDEVRNLYCLANIITVIRRRIRWVGHVAGMKHEKCALKINRKKNEMEGLFGKPGRRWKDSIKNVLVVMEC